MVIHERHLEERLSLPSIGPTELVLVFLIALVVLGPKRLPGVGRQVGRALREFRTATSQIRTELGVDEIVDEVNAVRADIGVDELARGLKKDADDISTSLKADMDAGGAGSAPTATAQPAAPAPPSSPTDPGAG